MQANEKTMRKTTRSVPDLQHVCWFFFSYSDTFADLEQNLQNIMGVNKTASTKTATTNPSTPTTNGGPIPAFGSVPGGDQDTDGATIVEAGGANQVPIATSRFQISPITDERPANLALDSKGTITKISSNGRFRLYFPFIQFDDIFEQFPWKVSAVKNNI